MSRNRYIGDYRIVESLDGRGRVRTGFEYTGPAYDYAEGAAVATLARRRVAALCVAGWAVWVGALIPPSAATRTLWVALPFIFAAIPLALATAIVARLFIARPPFEHRHADQVENRGPACTFLAALLAGVSLLGAGINALRGAALPGDAVFIACAAALLACGAICHRQWRRLRCVAAA